MQKIDFSKFEVSLLKTGSFPENKLNRTKVLYIDPKIGENHIIDLVTRIRKEIKPLGFEIPNRKYVPHLTICRVRSGSDIEDFTKNWLEHEFRELSFHCRQVELIKSDLTSTGAIYTTLYEYKLN